MSNQIQSLALQCLTASKNKRDEAVDMLEAMLQQKPSLLKAVLRDLWRAWVGQAGEPYAQE